MSDIPPIPRKKKRSGNKSSRKRGIRPLWIIAGIAVVGLLSLLICLMGSWPGISRRMTELALIQQYERTNGVKPVRVTPPDDQQPWRVFCDPQELFDVELTGWVLEGVTRGNGVETREFYAFDPKKSQSFTVTVYRLRPEQAANREVALKLIHDAQRDGLQQTEPQPLTWQGYPGFEARGMANPAVFKTVQPHFARDFFVQGLWVSLRAESPIGPYDEADALRAANSLKFKVSVE